MSRVLNLYDIAVVFAISAFVTLTYKILSQHSVIEMYNVFFLLQCIDINDDALISGVSDRELVATGYFF